MTQTAWQVTKYCLELFWRLFNSWYLPGTQVTPAGLLLFFSFTVIVIKFFNRFTDSSSVSLGKASEGPKGKKP